MCGIAGTASRTPNDSYETVVAMRDTMIHRGPDDAGIWVSADRCVTLGHRRLAIVDLTDAGHQPMLDPEAEMSLVFNGEIYNHSELRFELAQRGHRFRSMSDSEVILEAYREWGTDCLERFDGMFAFALHDRRSGTLLLARDRVGEKPLFVHMSTDHLAFASELKALFAGPVRNRRLNRLALEHYLAYGYVPADMCIVEGVAKLPAASALLYDIESGKAKSWRYWELPEPGEGPTTDDHELEIELEELLLRSVSLRMVADVPVGVLLSGGIDSSLLAVMASRASRQPIRTFTISFPGHGHFDEARHARLVADFLGTDHMELAAEPATVELLPTLARQFDEPIADSSMVPTYLLSRLVREHATVALGGDGADELFGGYSHHSWLIGSDRVRTAVPPAVRRLATSITSSLPVGLRGRNYLSGLCAPNDGAIASPNLLFDARTRARLLKEIAPVGDTPERWKASLTDTTMSLLQRATRTDFHSYLPDDILVKVDRASMLSSLEVRSPWLDHRIVEFAFGRLPDDVRATSRDRKILLRRLARRLLPPEFDVARKQGFSIPLHAWFRGPWGSAIEDALLGSSTTPFRSGVVQELIRGQRRGLNNSNRLFALAIFELWRAEHGVSVS